MARALVLKTRSTHRRLLGAGVGHLGGTHALLVPTRIVGDEHAAGQRLRAAGLRPDQLAHRSHAAGGLLDFHGLGIDLFEHAHDAGIRGHLQLDRMRRLIGTYRNGDGTVAATLGLGRQRQPLLSLGTRDFPHAVAHDLKGLRTALLVELQLRGRDVQRRDEDGVVVVVRAPRESQGGSRTYDSAQPPEKM